MDQTPQSDRDVLHPDGRRLGAQFFPSDAAAIVWELTAAMHFVELSAEEVMDGLDQAEERGVRGGNVHDWMHALAARKAQAEVLLPNNLTDFQNLADGFVVEPP